VDRLDVQPGDSITLDRVLLVADGDATAVGQPIVDGASVSAQVLGQELGEKIVVFKYKPKARTRVKKGFRSQLTTLQISDIAFGGKSAAKDAKTTEARKAKAEESAAREAEKAAADKAAADKELAAKLAAAAPAADVEDVKPKTSRKKATPKSGSSTRASKPKAVAADVAPDADPTPKAEAAPDADAATPPANAGDNTKDE
jgi:large subunit ribosomal protein L21